MNVIQDLFSSKKFVTALLGVLTAVAVRLGVPEVEITEIVAIVSPFLTYIGAQGFADLGKERVVAEAATTHTLGNFSFPAGDDQAILDAIARNSDAVRNAIS